MPNPLGFLSPTAFLGAAASRVLDTGSAAEDAYAITRAVQRQWTLAFAAKEAAGLVKLFSDDGVLVNMQGIFKGRQAVQAFLQAMFDRGAQSEETTVDQTRFAGGVVYGFGENTVRFESDEGKSQVKGRWSSVMLQSDGEWKLSLLTAFFLPTSNAN